jgi:hypothetical protein
MSGTYGYQGQLGIDTVAIPTVRFDYQREDLALDETFIDTNGLRGTRSRSVERERQGNRRVHGPLKLQPTAVELDLLLPWILYGATSGSAPVTYPLADAAPAGRYVTIDRGSKVPTYSGCQIDVCKITGRQGEPMEFALDVVGQDETLGNSGSFPTLSIDISSAPFIFTDLVLSIAGTAYPCKDVEITIDNKIDKERFFNSQTLVTVQPMDRHITLKTTVPFGTSSAVYGTGVAGVACVATFTGPGTQVLTMTFVKVVFPRKSPTTPGREEIMLPLMGQALMSSTTRELVTTLHQ